MNIDPSPNDHDDGDDLFDDSDSDEQEEEGDYDLTNLELDDSDDSDYDGGGDDDNALAPAPATLDFLSDDDDEDVDVDADGDVLNDAEMNSFHRDLKAASGFKKGLKGTRGGRRAVGDENYSFEVRSLMGEANQAFAHGRLDHAMLVVKKVIQIEAGVYSAWKILGEIFREKGDEHRCLLAWLTAAHAKPKDWDLWLMCAKMSLDQFGVDRRNYRDQAIYCYNRAIRANPDNIDAVYDRALLLKECGDLKKAADGFLMLNRLLPNDMGILKEIAGLYMELDRIPEAIEFYNQSAEFFQKNGNRDGAFTWSELNIMVELHMLEHQWKEAIRTLSKLGRWLYTRAEEKYWDDYDDDREWDLDDKRRDAARQYIPVRFPRSSYVLPLELRVKLGICRLKLGGHKEATHHFGFLKDVEPGEYTDLFQEAGDALYNVGAHEEAIHYYFMVLEGATLTDRKLWFNLATCYKALDQVDDAEDCYATVLAGYPTDAEAMMQLASIYEVSDRKEEALELVNTVIRLRRDAERASENQNAAPGVDPDQPPDPMAFLPNTPAAPKRARRKRCKVMTAAELLEMNERRTEQTLVKHRKLEYLRAGLLAGDADATKAWLDTAGELVDDFRNTRALYPLERGQAFAGFVATAMRRLRGANEKERLEKMQNRLQETLSYADDADDQPPPADATNFRGLPFDTWLYIFLQYAITLTHAEHNHQDAYDVCAAAKEANVFYRSRNAMFRIWSTWLACAVYVSDAESVSTLARWFMTTFQFQSEAYSLFVVALTASRRGASTFHNNANQKYLLRQIKVMDESLTGVSRINAASLTNFDTTASVEYKPQHIDVVLLMLYGHILAAGKSYISALNYYTRVYAVAPRNPMVLISIALAYLHRAMQRQSENRHMQALQGMAFIAEYKTARLEQVQKEQKHEGEKERKRLEILQETKYNEARAYHHLGLTHLAVRGYEDALKCSEDAEALCGGLNGDLKWEAAYNLQMIYVTSGNLLAAENVTERWLVI